MSHSWVKRKNVSRGHNAIISEDGKRLLNLLKEQHDKRASATNFNILSLSQHHLSKVSEQAFC